MTNFRPMLASNCKPEHANENMLGSIKLEGVRGIVTPDGLLTRALKPFKNELIYKTQIVQMLEGYCSYFNITIEGEFYLHGWSFNQIDSALRGNGNAEVNKLEFHVFDCYVHDHPDFTFEQRYQRYTTAVNDTQRYQRTLNGTNDLQVAGVPTVHAVVQSPCTTPQELLSAYTWCIENGYEGFVIKDKTAVYKHGRSTLKQGYFLRMKPEKDYDCVVLDILERMENLCESEVNELGQLKKRQDKDLKRPTGMAQTAVVFTPTLNKVHKVSLTKGLTDIDRMRLWEDSEYYKGKCMTFLGIPVPEQDVPRSPRFSKWREDLTPTFWEHEGSESVLTTWDVPEELYKDCTEISFEKFKEYILKSV